MRTRLIGFAGQARSGKNTAANYIMSLYPEFEDIAFADPIKNMLQVGLGLTYEQLYGDSKHIVDTRFNKTPRELMQTLGTEWGRNMVYPNLWVNVLRERIVTHWDKAFIITDIRFESEAAMVRNLEGIVIHIQGRSIHKDAHVSESGIYFDEGNDVAIINDSSLENFYKSIDLVIERFL